MHVSSLTCVATGRCLVSQIVLFSPSAAVEGAYSVFRTLESNQEAVPITPPESAHCPKQLNWASTCGRRGLMPFIPGVCAVPVSVGHVHITLN